MPAERDEPAAPPDVEIDAHRRIVVAPRATGWLAPAFRAGHEPSLQQGTNCYKWFAHGVPPGQNSSGLSPGIVVLVCAARRERVCNTSYNTNRTTEEKPSAALVRGVRTGAALWIMRGCAHGYD